MYFISRSLFKKKNFFLFHCLFHIQNWHLHRKALSSKRREKKISFYKGYCMYNPPLLQSVVKARLTHRGWCIWFIALGIVKMERRKKNIQRRKKNNIQSEWGEQNLLKIEFECVLVYICYSWTEKKIKKDFFSLIRMYYGLHAHITWLMCKNIQLLFFQLRVKIIQITHNSESYHRI